MERLDKQSDGRQRELCARLIKKKTELPPLRLAEAALSYPRSSGITEDTSAASVLSEAYTKWKGLWVFPDHAPPNWHNVMFPQPILRAVTQLRKTAKPFKTKPPK